MTISRGISGKAITVAGFGLLLLWALLVGTTAQKWGDSMWVRHGLLQELQNPHALPGMGLKKQQKWVGNALPPSSQENRTPR